MNRKESGFTLIELMIVIAIIAIIASIAIPNLMSSRLSANEAAAIATLRNLHSAQDQFHAMAAVDQDTIAPNNFPDGRGEFGYFRELAGTQEPRSSSPNLPGPITPGVMPGVFANLDDPGDGLGAAQRSGYWFRIFLPDAAGLPVGEPLAAAPGPGGYGAVPADANNQETQWVCVAWPVNLDNSGTRVFMVDASGEVMQTLNDANAAVRYGNGVNPPGDIAFAVAANVMAAHVANNTDSYGNFWTSAGN